MSQDPTIVIHGGSVELDYNVGDLPQVAPGKHHNPNKKVLSLRVKDNNTGIEIPVAIPTNGKCTITITYR